MIGEHTNGIALSRAYFDEVVEPLLGAVFPGLTYAAGRLGAGSDALSLDDVTSRDHDWGLRLSLLVPEDAVGDVDAAFERMLPASFRGWPTHFALSGQTIHRHHVEVSSVADFLGSHLGFEPRQMISIDDWLSLSGQAALEVLAGPVFVDHAGELTAARRALEWYPDDLWRYVLACDWIRIEQELPSMGRAADVGDELGSRLIAARLTQIVMHLAFLVERRWPPYAKWFGSMFRSLPCAADVTGPLEALLAAGDGPRRQQAIADALEPLLRRQNALGLTAVDSATAPFWDRPYLQPEPTIAAQLLAGIADPGVRGLPRGRGSVEQRTDNVDVLVSHGARRAAIGR